MIIDNPIENIMATTLANLKNIVDVNTVIGKPINNLNCGYTIIPISRLSMGFVVGGGEYAEKQGNLRPYAGGSGAGVSVTPIGFLLCNENTHKLVKLEEENSKLTDFLSAAINLFDKEKE